MGVSLDWLLGGVGTMFVNGSIYNPARVSADAIKEQANHYAPPVDDEREGVTPLIPFYAHCDANAMQDFWWLTAMIAERSLLQAGAVPDRDYSRIDLYKLAQPFVLERFMDDKLILQVSE